MENCNYCGGHIGPNDERVDTDFGEYHIECAEKLSIESNEDINE